MDPYELQVLELYTANGNTHVAMIPQYAVPPGEQWSINFVGIDLRGRRLLYIEVSSAQTPSARFIDKIRRRREWIPVVRKRLINETKVIDDTWSDSVVVFVVDHRVKWVKAKLGGPDDVAVEPLSRCFPNWLTGKPPCACCKRSVPYELPRVCPECGYVFKGNGWDGIDAHWRSRHESVMRYEHFWESLCHRHRGYVTAAG